MHFLLRRGLHSLLLLMGASLLSFLLASAAPGDFFDEMKINPDISKATLAALRSQYGLDRPLPERYLHWAKSVFRGECGFSLAYNSPAGPIVLARSGKTLLLTGTATLLAWMVALPLGGWAAAKPGSIIDLGMQGMVVTLLAMPELVLALSLLTFAVHTGYLPAGGSNSLFPAPDSTTWNYLIDTGKHLLLPGVCLAAGSLPLLLSHVRTAMAEALGSTYIVAAQSHGIPFRRALLRHAFPLAANPLISLFGFSLGMLISSSLLVESVFNWPGLGQLLLEAIQRRDFFLVVDATVLSTAFLLGGNFLADILLYANDPRIRVR